MPHPKVRHAALALIVSALGVQPALADTDTAATVDLTGCGFIEPPTVPDGASADQDAMAAAATSVREFAASMQDSLACIDKAEAGLGEEITPEQKQQINSVYNNGVDQMNAVVSSFNEQVRAYKEANPE